MSPADESPQVRRPRILHLSSVDFGGAGGAALLLHAAMHERGFDSTFVAWDARSRTPGVIPFGRTGWAAVRRFAGRAWYRLSSRRRYMFRDQGTRCLSRRRLIDIASRTKPDLIIVHYVSDFVSFSDIALLQELTGANVVFHLLDMGLLTGGCHYAWGCEKYRNGCGHCPALLARFGQDASARVLARKISVTRSIPHGVVVPSSQLAKESAGSAVFAHASLHRILIGVDPEKLGTTSLERARDALGIGRDGVLLLFGAQKLSDPRKGMQLLFDALKSLDGKHSLREQGISLLVIGKSGDLTMLDDLAIPIHRLGYVGPKKLALAYCAADYFLCPSIEDSGPMMVNEAMMSGTPVVGFPIGVLPDLVEHDVTGALAETINSPGLSEALSRVLEWDGDRRKQARKLCRVRALETCSIDAQVRAFAALAPN